MSVDSAATPEAVLLAALAARDAWRYERVVALADPASVAERFASYREARRPKTLDDFRVWHPDIPEHMLTAAFARWREATGERDADARIARSVPGVSSYAEIVALTPAAFLARWMAADDPRAELVERLRARGREVPPALRDTPPGVRYVTLGSVLEPPDLAHVLYRELYERDGASTRVGEVQLESLRRQPDGSWRLLATRPFFLRSRGGTAWVIDDELADLWSDERPDSGDNAPAA